MGEIYDFRAGDKAPTLERFARSDASVRGIVGPFGSGKSTKCVKEIVRRALRQLPGADGKRRTRWAVIRNTYPELRDTTRKTFEQWIPARLGQWHEQAFQFDLRFDDVEAEVLFRPLDRPEDLKKLLSLELTGAYVNEVREIPEAAFDVLDARVGRYPPMVEGGPSWSGIWFDSNPWHASHWMGKRFAKLGAADGYELFRQPSGRSAEAENIKNLRPGYYDRLCIGKDQKWIDVYVDGKDAVADEGAIFGAWIAELREQKRICAFDHPTDGVYTSWDLGHGDSTAIWFWRLNALGALDVIDHYENHGEGLSHYFGVVDGRGYKYLKHWLPHDAKQKTLATQLSVLEQCAEHWGVGAVAIGPQLFVMDGIHATRWVLEQPATRIHERCAKISNMPYSGIEALEGYRWNWNELLQCYSREPIHNWASHTSDAFRGMACVVRFTERMTRPPESTKTGVDIPAPAVTLDKLWEEVDQESDERI